MQNLIDKIVGYYNPVQGLKRVQARSTLNNIVEREYDVASKGRRNQGWWRPSSTAAQEVSKSAQISADSARELVRNNPLANRIPSLWANNIVGKEIILEAYSKSKADREKKKIEKFNDDYDEWASSTDCDFEGHTNFGGLQWLWAHSVAESGAIFVRKHVSNDKDLVFPLQLQTFEQDRLDKSKSGHDEDGNITIDGIKFNSRGKRIGYWFLTEVTNTKLGKPPESKFYDAKDILHIYKKKRAGQHLGMTWLHSTATTLRNYETYKDAKLMQQQIAACFAVIMEAAESETSTTRNTDGDALRPDTIEPAMIEYVEEGTKPHTINPPKADNSTNFDTGLKRDIAIGSGVTPEQMTGDYSQVNFASGRMGRSDFYQELDTVQWHVFAPKLNKVADWFWSLHNLKNGTPKVKYDWTFPPRSSVNPQEELDILITKVRNGLMSPRKACKILGEKLTHIIKEWEEDKKVFKDLPFDIDPSKFASTGNQLDDNDAASSNNSVTKNEPKAGSKDEQVEKEKKGE